MGKEHGFIDKIRPRTLGEKMLTTGVAIDIGVIATLKTLYYLQDKGITHIPAAEIETTLNVLFWGGHIVVSDAILKVGGIIRMTFFEDENWLFKKRNRVQ